MSTAASAASTRASQLGAASRRSSRPERHVLGDGRHEQLVVGVLEHDADPTADLAQVRASPPPARPPHAALLRGEDAVEVQHERGLARRRSGRAAPPARRARCAASTPAAPRGRRGRRRSTSAISSDAVTCSANRRRPARRAAPTAGDAARSPTARGVAAASDSRGIRRPNRATASPGAPARRGSRSGRTAHPTPRAVAPSCHRNRGSSPREIRASRIRRASPAMTSHVAQHQRRDGDHQRGRAEPLQAQQQVAQGSGGRERQRGEHPERALDQDVPRAQQPRLGQGEPEPLHGGRRPR